MELNNFLNIFENNSILITFFMSVLGGDTFVILLAFLSGSNMISLYIVFIFSILGFIISDTFWFLISKSQKLDNLTIKFRKAKFNSRLRRLINKISDMRSFKLLFYSKFIYGTRVATIFYIGKKDISLIKFELYTILTNFLWISIIVLIGYLAGKGVSYFVYIFENFTSFFIGFSLFIILILVLKLFLIKLLNN